MSILDILFLVLFAYAIYRGYKSGFVVELCGILGVILGVWVAYLFSDRIFDFFGITDGVGRIVGYVVIVLAVLLGVGVLAKLVSRVLDFTGLGMVNRLLGSVASLVKTIILLSLFVLIFDMLNNSMRLVNRSQIDGSSFYNPMMKIASTVFPYVGEMGTYINASIESITEGVSVAEKAVKEQLPTKDSTFKVLPDSVVVDSSKSTLEKVRDFFSTKKDSI